MNPCMHLKPTQFVNLEYNYVSDFYLILSEFVIPEFLVAQLFMYKLHRAYIKSYSSPVVLLYI